MTINEIYDIIYLGLDEINLDLPKNKQIAKNPNSLLFGRDGNLDSLALVNLIVEIESLIEEKTNNSITLANEKAMSLNNSPFLSIKALAEYILTLLD
jgi:acyl carrier protein